MAVGEGRADAPVGTTLALIDQATKILNSVHKRMHTAQAEEFQLLLECFKENPESFWQRNRKPAYPWDEQTFMKAIEDYDLVPQADPNTASQTQRVMKVMALKQLAQSNPGLYDPIAVDIAALQAIGWNNPEQFMAPMSAQGKIPPEMQQAIAEIQIKNKDADTRAKLADAKIAEIASKIQSSNQPDQPESMSTADQLKFIDLDVKAADAKIDAANRAADRESRERLALLQLVQKLIEDPTKIELAEQLVSGHLIQKLENEG
jgi:hypothetical protein